MEKEGARKALVDIKGVGEMDSYGVDEEIIRKWHKAMTDFSLAITECYVPVFKSIKNLCEAFSDYLWTAYTEAGMPYGETSVGMWKWARECIKIEGLRREAESMEINHRQMVAFRRMVAGGEDEKGS